MILEVDWGRSLYVLINDRFMVEIKWLGITLEIQEQGP